MTRWEHPADIVPAFGSVVRIEFSAGDDLVGMVVETSDTHWTVRKLSANKRSLNKRRSSVHVRYIKRWRFAHRSWEQKLDPGTSSRAMMSGVEP